MCLLARAQQYGTRFGELPETSNFVRHGPAVQSVAPISDSHRLERSRRRRSGAADVFTKFEVNGWTSCYWNQLYAGLGLGTIQQLT